MTDTIFDKIVRGDIPSYKVWEDDNYLAFLTPFPNTPGFTVVIPKTNPGDYVFALPDDVYHGLMSAAQKVAKKIEKALGVKRVALVFEGTGVAYVHAKLIPLHGELGEQTDVWSKHTEFHEEYPGFITTAEGPQMDESRLKEIQSKIQAA
jgi:diadenosine tetraphosphate (Ap4A) HIT family hydrolase